ncbi:MAG: TIM barrel protein [Pseudomonadota bacterium]|nr:TIM barrel protein [Pseudomonadota bacterium]
MQTPAKRLLFGIMAQPWVSNWRTLLGSYTIEDAAKAGVDLVEFPLLDPRKMDGALHRRQLSDHGLAATCTVALPPMLHLPDQPVPTRDFLMFALDKAAELGSTYLGGTPYGALGMPKMGAPTFAERAVCARVLSEVAVAAQARGIVLGIEPVNRYESNLYNTIAEVLALIEEIGATNVRVQADTFHMSIEEKGFAAPLRAAGARLGYVHLSESDRLVPGTGNVNWQQLFAGLAEAGYAGPVVLKSLAAVETFDPNFARGATMRLEDLYKQALPFLAQCAHAAGYEQRVFTPAARGPAKENELPLKAHAARLARGPARYTAAQTAANKAVGGGIQKMMLVDKKVDEALQTFSDAYLQHNPFMEAGKGALRDFKSWAVPMANTTLLRVVADGDLVLTHLTVAGFGPNPRMVFFDVYRIDDGKIVEHWDTNQFTRPPNPSGHTMIDGPTEVTDHDKTDANRALVNAYMDQVAVPGRYEKLAEFWRDDLIQHNPLMADGIRGFLDYRAAAPEVNVPTRYTKRHFTIAEGNFVLTTAEVDVGGTAYALYELWRVQEGKIAEHWDVMQRIPAVSANGQPVF